MLIDQKIVSPETRAPESAIARLADATFGPNAVQKSVQNGAVVWELPCNLATGLESTPREEGEALFCYFKRLAEEADLLETKGPDGDPGPDGPQGSNGWTFTTSSFVAPTSSNSVFWMNVAVMLPFFDTLRVVFVENLGWVTVQFLVNANTVACSLRALADQSLAIIPAGSRVVVTGREGIPADYATPAEVQPVTFSPEEEFFVRSTNVTLASATVGATIYYTIDGSDPTVASPTYSVPFPISADATVKAFAVKSGLVDSHISYKNYTRRVPVTVQLNRTYPEPVTWPDLYVADLGHLIVDIPITATNLVIYCEGSACTYNVGADGWPSSVSLLPEGTDVLTGILMGVDGDIGSHTETTTITAGIAKLYLAGFFRAGAQPASTTIFEFYAY